MGRVGQGILLRHYKLHKIRFFKFYTCFILIRTFLVNIIFLKTHSLSMINTHEL